MRDSKIARNSLAWGNITRYHRSQGYKGTVAYRDPIGHHRPRSYPNIIPYRNVPSKNGRGSNETALPRLYAVRVVDMGVQFGLFPDDGAPVAKPLYDGVQGTNLGFFANNDATVMRYAHDAARGLLVLKAIYPEDGTGAHHGPLSYCYVFKYNDSRLYIDVVLYYNALLSDGYGVVYASVS